MRKVTLIILASFMLSACSTFEWEEVAAFLRGDYATEQANLPSGAGQNSDSKQIDAGKEHFARGNYGLALQSFREALWEEEYALRALNGLAASYDKLGRYDLSQRYYTQALALAPESPETLNNIGYSMLLQGRQSEAVDFLERAAALAPESSRILANIALAQTVNPHENYVETAEVRTTAPTMWIEKTTDRIYTLVTRPDPVFLAEANNLGIDPRIVSIDGGR